MQLGIIITSYFALVCSVLSTDLPQVSIEQGTLRGSYLRTFRNRQIASFEGIPFAKPPTEKNRFKEPVPAGPWKGIYYATKAPPQCLQRTDKEAAGSEDCLYLNVYAPQLNKNQSKPLDVIAFIHGGAFYGGKSTDISPYLLLDRNVILVTFNYRLGPLGFLSTEDDVVPGNNGLKDQLLALKWIQQNIAAFGGNPDSVTLVGESAGGASCHYHVLSPLSKGLFKRAMCMSGVAANPWAQSKGSKEKAMIIANQLGCPTDDSLQMIDCLRDRPAGDIVDLSKTFSYWRARSPPIAFSPIIEHPHPNAFIAENPIKIIKEHKGSDIPLFLSHVQDEGLVEATELVVTPGLFDELLERWDELAPSFLVYNYTITSDRILEVNRKIKDFYKLTNSSSGVRQMIKMLGDRLFVSETSKIVKLSAAYYTSPVYMYRFSYRGKHSVTEFFGTKEDLGICHGDDNYYTVGVFNIFNNEDANDLIVSNRMLDLMESFAAGKLDTKTWKPTSRDSSKIIFTDIKGPDDFQTSVATELGEESFWDSLGFDENKE